MATTTPDNIRTPDPSDPYNLVPDLAQMAGDVQTALIQRANSYKGTSTQRTSFTTSAADGVIWQDTNSPYRIWRKQGGSGGSWQPLVPFEDTGWVTLTPASGFSVINPSYPLQARRIGSIGFISGGVTGPLYTNVVTLFPSWFTPSPTGGMVVLPGSTDTTFCRIQWFSSTFQIRNGTMSDRSLFTIPLV